MRSGSGEKRRFNIIDVIVILAVIAVVGTLVLRKYVTSDISKKLQTGTLEYEFLISSVRKSSGDLFEVGTQMFSQSTEKKVGTVVSLNTPFKDAEAYIEIPDGEIVKTYIPDRTDISGIARVEGSCDENGRCLMFGTDHIAPGKSIYAKTKDMSFMFTVESVKFIPAQ